MAQPKAQISVDTEDQQRGHGPVSLTLLAGDGEGDSRGLEARPLGEGVANLVVMLSPPGARQ